MKLKQYLWIAVCLIALVGVLPAYSQQSLPLHPGFQVSTLGALNVGVYEGATTLAELKPHGDFGLGTLEGLDGGMVLLDSKFYQIKTNKLDAGNALNSYYKRCLDQDVDLRYQVDLIYPQPRSLFDVFRISESSLRSSQIVADARFYPAVNPGILIEEVFESMPN
jgi:Alpha-acetolactate decarboxylase